MSGERVKALTLLATVVGLALMMVWLEVQFNYWNREFYNTFENRDEAEFFRQLGMFALLALVWIITAVYRLYFLQMLQIEWRTWLTNHFLADWMKDQAHYRMQLLDRGTDNPDQRIAEDLRIFVEYTSDLALGPVRRGHAGFLRGDPVDVVGLAADLRHGYSRLSRLGGAGLRDRRHVPHALHRPQADRARFQPAARRG